ncbi:Cyclic nucleotide-binding-like [Phytophthora cactorum]|nr:Cyclic nucleotide-binding-like [Phytophthora cactorum]
MSGETDAGRLSPMIPAKIVAQYQSLRSQQAATCGRLRFRGTLVDATMVKHEWPGLSEFRDHAVSGVVLPHVPAHEVLEKKVVRDAERIGLSNLSMPPRASIIPSLSQRFTRAIQVLPKPTQGGDQTNKRRLGQRSLVVLVERFKAWIVAWKRWCTLANLLAAASFADSLYLLLSAPLRVGFFFDPWQDTVGHDVWKPGIFVFTVADMTGSFLRVWNSRVHLSVGVRLLLKLKVSPSELAPQQEEEEEEEEDEEDTKTNANSNRSIRSTTSSGKRRTLPDGWIAWLVLVVYCIPWELLVLLVLRGQRINILHVLGLFRLLTAHSRIDSQLAATIGGIPQKLSSGTVANVLVLFVYGVYFCHVAACGYMLVAHWECGLDFRRCVSTPVPSGCWVLRDRLETGSYFRQYVRTLYWACKTVVTLGQGDLIPVTLVETGYRIVVQFFAGLWVTAILTAYTFFFAHKDANLTSNISTRLDQALQFLTARKAPAQLVTSVDTYFQYMQRTRNGVEEELILAALPPHYRTQCSHYVRYKAIAPLAIFRRRKGAFLRTVMEALVRDVYAPDQTLLEPGETDEMFIVACGEVRLIDARGEVCIGRITAGNAYAEYALFERHVARHRLEAATFCEVWYLPTKAFKAALAKHFTKLVYASLLLQQFGTKPLTATSNDDVDSVTSMKTRARQSKLLGHGSLLLQAVEARRLRSAAAAIAADAANLSSDRTLSSTVAQLIVAKTAAWRMPNSKFRTHWALAECILMLYLLAEVPYHLAFQRGFGLLNGVAGTQSDGTTPRSVQMATFLVSLTVEVFFYVDLVLRAFYFVRPFPGVELDDEFLGTSTRKLEPNAALGSSLNAPTIALATRRSQIFQLYLQHESLMLEIVALAPAALIWDVLPKELFSRRSVHMFRCLRLLRLFRVRKLRGKLHGVLAGRGYGPALRLLAEIVIFCSATSHAAACIFFAVADRTSFEGGLPVNGVAPRSLSLSTCLEDASRFDNCTWYMYDRSTFDMDAPYLRSMLWSIVLLSTVGFGDIIAFSTRECIVDALWIFFSANICYITSCALSSVLAQINVLSTIRHDRIEGINVLLMSPSMASVSDATKRTIRSYYEAKWKLNGSAVGDLGLLEHLPRSLRRAITSQLYAPDLRRCALFVEECGLRASSASGDAALFMQQLALTITCEHFLRNVTVIKEGLLASEFFVILSGELECLLPPVPFDSKSKLEKRGAHVLDPTKTFARWWHRSIGFILVYNFYVIVFRLAFLPYPDATTMVWFTGIDYTLDILLYADVFLKFGHLGYIEFGEPVLDPQSIKESYRASGRLWQDCLGMLPLYYRGDMFGMTAARLPRLLRCLQLGELLQEVHTEIQERFLRGNAALLSVFDLVKFFLIFVSTAHYIASFYYLIGWAQLETGLVTTSWISVDLVLRQNPNSPMVHYMRSMYWCLSSVIDCFGDILARNFLESCYELFTCVLGWVFIGQVIGRINALMITLDKTQKQRKDRVEDFQQYAKQRALPNRLRQRAMKGLAVKAQCQLELDLHKTLQDLPGALRALVAVEMYSGLLRPLPEFAQLSRAQLETVARALVLEIYLPGDIICETNRMGTRLYILKHGCAERVAPGTGIVYGTLTDGALFGEFAFFLPGARRLFFVRAVRSCQVLQLHRRVWDRLWPPAVRVQVEQTVLAVVTRMYRRTAWGFLNIAKNFYIKNDSPVPALGPQRPSIVSGRPVPFLKSTKSREPAITRTVATRHTSGNGVTSVLPTAIRTPVVSFRRRVSASDMSSVSENADTLDSFRDILGSFRSTRKSFVAPKSCTEVSHTMVSAFNDAVSPLLPNSVATEDPLAPLARLSAITELNWKTHEKRLRAIQLFYVAWGHVRDDLRRLREAEGSTRRVTQRRVSISVPPSYSSMREARLEEVTAKVRVPVKRRHSIQSDPVDLRSKFMLSPSEVRILEERMATSPAVDTKTRPPHPTMLAQAATSRTRSIRIARSLWSRWWRRISISNRKVTPFASTAKATNALAVQSSPYSIWAAPSTRTARIDQNSRFRDVWASIMLIVTLYYLIAIPLQIGFLDGVLNETQNERIVIAWFTVEYVIADVACLVDFVLHRNYFVYQTSSGEAVTDPGLMFGLVVALRQAGYAPPPATTSEWPLLFSPLGGLVNWHTFAFLRINRFLRIVHLRPLSDRLQRFLLYDRRLRRLTPGICYLIRLALDFLLGTHWLSCLFYGVSYLVYDDGEQSWLTTADMLAFGDHVRTLADIRKVPLIQSYLRTYHFSIGAITTVCYGDIVPMNAHETLVTMAVIFISVGIFSMLSGGFYKYFDMELGRRAEYEEKVAQVGHFLRFHHFPSDSWRQMQVYFALSWRESRGRRERELLRGLPPSVRQDLAQHVHASLLKNVALFTRCDPAFARAIIAALQHEFFVRNDVIIQRGDMERSLYIVESGIVLISAVRKRPGSGDDIAAGAEEEEERNDHGHADGNNSPSVSVNEWVRVSVCASTRMRKKADVQPARQRQKSLVAHMSPTGTVADINKQTEREEKIYKGPFDYFGERSLLFGTPRNATCMALCVTSLFVLTSARFEAILDEFPHERSNSVSAWVMTRTPATKLETGE